MKTIRFNTGRKYTVHGQRIVATLHDDGVVTFFDHDRSVDGEFMLGDDTFDGATVMRAYDSNRARSSHRSWSDGMLRNGCNIWVREV
jgi:hypothetical protein